MMRLLDLYCGGGGAGRGYADAGFDVTGVDIAPQKHYPFRFIQADAIEYCARHGHEYDLIHASPPCQRYSVTKSLHTNEHPDLVPDTRAALIATGRPFVIENVVGAPLIEPLMLCGQMFPGLRVYRHRLFECSFFILAPPHPRHAFPMTPMGRKPLDGTFLSIGGHVTDPAGCGAAMGITHRLTQRGVAQAIPPAYTRFIGTAFLQREVAR
jgi:DNA (cytosine-5)-methyltransferase 1